MDHQDEWVVVGRFGRAHGIKGYISVISFTDPQDNILHYTDWHVRLKHQWSPLATHDHEINNKLIIVKVEGYTEREDVACLTNCEIAIKRAQLPALTAGDYYWHELIGMQVVTEQGVLLGSVIEMMSTGAHDILVVNGEHRHLVPYVMNHYVLNIDDKKRQITVNWDPDF